MMSQASRIGSVIYQALPQGWRQGWMYRAFTGEAVQMLKEGTTVEETTRLLWKRYVEAINHKGEDLGSRLQAALDSAALPPMGTRKKTHPRVERLKPYSDLLAEASKLASEFYKSLPVEKRKSGLYRACVAEAMRFLQKHKEPLSQGPGTKFLTSNANAVAQSLPIPEKDSLEVSRESVAKPATKQAAVRQRKKLTKSTVRTRLFHIPPVNRKSQRRFVRRRKHAFRWEGRSP